MGLPQSGPFMFRSGGSGSGTSNAAGINYLSAIYNGDTLTGINTYNDGASSTPTDGTGGVVTGLTTALNTTTPLVGTSCVRFSKDAANRQGEGWSYDFTVDRISYESSQPVYIQFYYRTSAAYANSDLRVFVYDKDAGTLLNVQDISNNSGNILASTTDALFTGVFYTTTNSNDYRLIWHITSTNANAYDFDIDCFQASPVTVTPGGIAADYGTEAWTDSWANSTTSVRLTRLGQYIFVQGLASITGAGATQFDITIPTAYAPASNYTFGSNEAIEVGFSNCYDLSGTANVAGWASLTSSTNLRILYSNSGAIAGLTSTLPFTWASGDKISFNACWIVSGWAAGTALSTTEAMLSTARYQGAGGDPASATSGNPIIFPASTWDNFSAYNTTTGLYTVPRTGYYRMHGRVSSANTAITLIGYVNSSASKNLGTTDSNGEGTFTGTLFANKGDTISLRPNGTIDCDNGSVLQIEELPDFGIFSVYGQFEIQTLTSAQKTPSGSGQYHALTSNSVTLTPGTWRLVGNVAFLSSGSPAYTQGGLDFYSTNGADSASSPTLLSATTGVTVLSSQYPGGLANFDAIIAAGGTIWANRPSYIIRLTQTVTIYLVSYSVQTTSANARVTVYGTAERLQ